MGAARVRSGVVLAECVVLTRSREYRQGQEGRTTTSGSRQDMVTEATLTSSASSLHEASGT